MYLLFILSQKHLPLALAEVCTLYGARNVRTSNKYAFVKFAKEKSNAKKTKKHYKKLAFTKAAYEILFSSSQKKLETDLKKYNWNKTITGTFCVRGSVDEQKFASIIWDSLKHPRVDLKNPATLIHFFFIGRKIYATKLLWKNENAFLHRKPQYRPALYPASLDPQLALAMVNLSGVIRGTIVDPFCGTGGILIEAALSGREAIGYDISRWMLGKCKQNLKYYKLKIPISVKDATIFSRKCKAIVTELPFGKNTKSQDLVLLYTLFLKNAKNNTKKVVVSFPDFVDYKEIIKKADWKILYDFHWYLHATLSKHIVVLF